MSEKKYKLDRKRFILYYQDSYIILSMIKKKKIINSLILGSEFVITAEDILASMKTIPGCLVDVDGRVNTEDCELIYIQ